MTRVGVASPMQGTVVSIDVTAGDMVPEGRALFVLESMKMQHDVVAPAGGRVEAINVAAGDTVNEGQRLAVIELAEVAAALVDNQAADDLDAVREDLAEVVVRHDRTLDAARPEAVERRRKTKQRTVRENITDLCDEGSFTEYAPLVIAAQRRRRAIEELIDRTPADGLVCGLARVNGERFGDEASRCVVMSY